MRFVIANIIDNYQTSGREIRGKAGRQVPARGMCPVNEQTVHSATACYSKLARLTTMQGAPCRERQLAGSMSLAFADALLCML